MIVDLEIWTFLVNKYEMVDKFQEISRFGILVNEETEEAIVEIYFR